MEDYRERCRDWAPGGVDAVIDALGLDAFRKSFRCLGRGGILIAYGMQDIADGADPRMIKAMAPVLNLAAWNLLPNRRRSRFYIITAERKKHPEEFRRDLQTLLEMMETGAIRPQGHVTMPLSAVREAHEIIDARSRVGRIVLIP
jgi:NADPH:quinone reductase-like Zn-dependent oxidoreductase